jgi:hypothetical protein
MATAKKSVKSVKKEATKAAVKHPAKAGKECAAPKKAASAKDAKKKECGCAEDKDFCVSSVAVIGISDSAQVCTARSHAYNLKRLSDSPILHSFVQDNAGEWDHHGWLGLCDKIEKEGFSPIDFDQVGLLLEKAKAKFQRAACPCDIVVL